MQLGNVKALAHANTVHSQKDVAIRGVSIFDHFGLKDPFLSCESDPYGSFGASRPAPPGA